MKTYALNAADVTSLGDKQEFNYQLEPARERFNDLLVKVKEWLSENDQSAAELLGPDGRHIEQYEIIRNTLGLTAGRDQDDVIGFIRILLQEAHKTSP